MMSALDISTSAIVAQRTQLDVIAGNIANHDVTSDEFGNPNPYRRRVALLASGNPAGGPDAPGVHVAQIVEDASPFGLRWDPYHKDVIQRGDDKGYVRTPNVNYHTEMVNAMLAARAYEANITVMEVAKSMASTALRLIA